jgi:hypothetical protein
MTMNVYGRRKASRTIAIITFSDVELSSASAADPASRALTGCLAAAVQFSNNNPKSKG